MAASLYIKPLVMPPSLTEEAFYIGNALMSMLAGSVIIKVMAKISVITRDSSAHASASRASLQHKYRYSNENIRGIKPLLRSITRYRRNTLKMLGGVARTKRRRV